MNQKPLHRPRKKRPQPGYVSVVLDRRVKGRGPIVPLHSFGLFSFEALARAEQFRVNCELALRLYRKAVTEQDRATVFAVFTQMLGKATLDKLIDAARLGTEVSIPNKIDPVSPATAKLQFEDQKSVWLVPRKKYVTRKEPESD